MIPKEKVHISTHRSQERPFGFLKGKNGDTKETGQYLTIQDSENLREASFEPYKTVPEEKSSFFILQESGTSL